jgi:hypothetical protein
MQTITNNPYRTLGLLAGASSREITRQTNNLKKYIAAGAEPPADYSFAVLDNFLRTANDIDTATAKLNLDDDRMLAALFWFWKGNDITDEPAFDALKEGNADTAYRIWDKLIITTEEDGRKFWKEVTVKNASAFHNQAILSHFNHSFLSYEGAVIANIMFIESNYFSKFVKSTVDVTYKVSKKDIELKFLEVITNEITDKKTSVSLSRLVKYLNNYDFLAKADFLKSVSQRFTTNITAQIETARKARTANKQNAATAGEKLYENTNNDLTQLKEIFGVKDFSYSNIADKVANEILQCGIDYFNHYKDNSLDPGNLTMSVFKTAKMVAVGQVVKQRCKENIEGVQEWIDDKPEREKQNKVKNDFEFITEKLKRFQTLSDTVANAKNLAESCKLRLANIKNVLGANDDFYLKLSSAVVNNVQGMLVTVVNKAQETIQFQTYMNASTTLISLKSTIREALEVTNFLGSFDMESSLRSRYNTNKSTLQSLYNQVSNLLDRTTSSYVSSSHTLSSKSGNNWIWWLLGILTILGIIIGAINEGNWIDGGIIGFVAALMLIGLFFDRIN